MKTDNERFSVLDTLQVISETIFSANDNWCKVGQGVKFAVLGTSYHYYYYNNYNY